MKTYLWQEVGSDRMNGFFHSIKSAHDDVAREAQEREERIVADVWLTRAAKKSDAELFEGAEQDGGNTCDTSKPGWQHGRVVPISVARRVVSEYAP